MATNGTTPLVYSGKSDGRLPYSGTLHSLVSLILILSLILPSSILSTTTRRWLFLPIFLISSHLIFQTTTGDVMADLGLGPHLACEWAMCLDYIVLCDPRKTFKLKKEEKEKDKRDRRDTLWSRINPRGIGWTHEPPSHFIIAKIGEAILCASLEAGTYILNAYNPALTNPSSSMLEHAFRHRAFAVLLYACNTYARLNIIFSVVSVLFVGLGLSQPDEWPQMFGSIWESWSVGRFWSRTWHHVLRRTLTSITDALLPPKRNSTTVYIFSRLMMAFLVSGLLHEAGEYMMAGKFSAGSLAFFILQPIAIGLERAVFMSIGVSSDSLAGNGKKPAFIARALRFVWVLVWFLTTAPIVIAPIVSTGMFVHKKENRNFGAITLEWLKMLAK
ncbi:membrane bound O-acyl transferase family-domain-containing protein [Cyathus striatus]|nr:membrane bound O-acyl transferase family-domain-containing protein [Cyathus striatus]